MAVRRCLRAQTDRKGQEDGCGYQHARDETSDPRDQRHTKGKRTSSASETLEILDGNRDATWMSLSLPANNSFPPAAAHWVISTPECISRAPRPKSACTWFGYTRVFHEQKPRRGLVDGTCHRSRCAGGLEERTVAFTLCPDSKSCHTTSAPRKPPAPVTHTACG